MQLVQGDAMSHGTARTARTVLPNAKDCGAVQSERGGAG